jgi:hypothetical protein
VQDSFLKIIHNRVYIEDYYFATLGTAMLLESGGLGVLWFCPLAVAFLQSFRQGETEMLAAGSPIQPDMTQPDQFNRPT